MKAIPGLYTCVQDEAATQIEKNFKHLLKYTAHGSAMSIIGKEPLAAIDAMKKVELAGFTFEHWIEVLNCPWVIALKKDRACG